MLTMLTWHSWKVEKFKVRSLKTAKLLQNFIFMKKMEILQHLCLKLRQTTFRNSAKNVKTEKLCFSKLFYRSLKMLLHETTSGSFTNPSAWEIYATLIHLFPANCTFISSSYLCEAVRARVCSGASQASPVPKPITGVLSPAGRHNRLLCLLRSSGQTIFGTHRAGVCRDWQSVLLCFIPGFCHWHAVQL